MTLSPKFSTLRRALVLPALILAAVAAHARPMQDSTLRVAVRQPGTLAAEIGEVRKYHVASLAIEGTLNGSDLRFLREMAGSDYHQRPTAGNLRSVDLSRATYARGGEPYILKDEARHVQCGANSLPDFLFRNCKVEHVVLPERMDTIGIGAFEYSALRNIRIPEDAMVAGWAFNHCDSLATVEFPQHLMELRQDVFRDCSRLRKIHLHDIQFLPYHAFEHVTGLEEIVVDGTLFHVDGWFCNGCPQLRRIEFSGNVLSTGGRPIASHCPRLEEITFSGFCLPMYFGSVEDCPLLRRCNVTGYVVSSADSTFIPHTTHPDAADIALLRRAAAAVSRFGSANLPMSKYAEAYTFYIGKFIPMLISHGEKGVAMDLLRTLSEMQFPYYRQITSSTTLASLSSEKDYDKVMKKLQDNGDFIKILRQSPPYDTGAAYRHGATPPSMAYATVEDTALQRIRRYFQVDYIAGSGDELTRLKNIMFWVHDRIRHRGSYFPKARHSAIELFESCRKAGKDGMNARGQAIILAELYESLGWPARFITCMPKYYKYDPDATVVTAVWSFSLGKWIMMDASNAAYVTDENGLPLHPGEIRQRMKDGRPLVLNKEANWNFTNATTHENYLDYYMAKNLYYLCGYRCNRPGIESETHQEYYTLVPDGEQTNIGTPTHDDAWFWQSPF